MGSIGRFLILSCFLAASYGSLVSITHRPSYLELNENAGSLKVSEIEHVLLSFLGFTSHKELQYHGIYAPNPFNHPKASVLVTVYSDHVIAKDVEGDKIKLQEDEVYVPTHNLQHHIQKFYEDRSDMLKLDLDTKVRDLDGVLESLNDDTDSIRQTLSRIGNFSLLDLEDPLTFKFLRQCSLILQALPLWMREESHGHDLMSFEIMVPSTDNKNVNKEMQGLAKVVIAEVQKAVSRFYGDNFIMMIVNLSNSKPGAVRKTRSLMAEADPTTTPAPAVKNPHNLSEAWTEDYAVIFHIILWLVVFMALVVIYAMHAMMTMDPGSDSIIYRMTTQRMKKDN